MFSLVITIISIALVAALALATLYYGGSAFREGHAKAEASKLRVQGQQLLAAAELFYVNKGYWPHTFQEMVNSGHLSAIPVAQRAGLQQALAAQEWQMPAAQTPLFVYDNVAVDVCRYVNEDSYGLDGVLPKLQPGYAQQCFGPSSTELVVVVSRSNLSAQVAAVNDGLLVPDNVSTGAIPDASDADAWTVPPGGATTEVSEPTPPAAPQPGDVTVDPATLNFNAVATHSSDTLDATLTNASDHAVALAAPAVSGAPEFTVNSTTCGPTLPAGGSCVTTVRYSPTTVAASQAGTLDLAQGVSVTLAGSSYNPVALTGATLPEAKLNKAYAPVSFSEYLTVSNEGTPDLGQVVWEAQGELPAGLSFDDQTGTLSGTPTALTAEAGQDLTISALYKQNQGQQVYTIRVGEAVLRVTQIATGRYHTCAVTEAGGVKCWGQNTNGVLGDGTTTNRTTPVDVVGLTSGVARVELGLYFSCALTSGGGVKCWGDGGSSQLGNGGVGVSYTPVDVVGLSSGVTNLSLGAYHACAVVGGGAKCWGSNRYGSVGDNTTTSRSTPTNVTGLTSGVVQVAAGSEHTCALTTSGGAKCWGFNGYGQLGNGTTSLQVLTQANVTGLTSGVASVAALGNSSCARTTSGGVKCWGGNTNGDLGDGTTTNRTTPVDVVGLTSGVAQLSTGCAVTTSGGAKCWGYNANGVLGDGTTTNRTTPVNVTGLSSGVSSIARGANHTCAIVSGVAKCWGHNLYGQLGDGTNTGSPTPVSVSE